MKILLSLVMVVCFLANYALAGNSGNFRRFWDVDGKSLNVSSPQVKLHPDTGLNISQFLHKYNYPLESHEVTTEDGYILTLHRIPRGRNENNNSEKEGKNNVTKPVVFLVHGLGCSAINWIYQGPNTSLALLLADIGYDVWIANARGTVVSSRHTTLTSSNASYWDFSFHEKGYYDMAANIDYILNNTKVDKVTYIGHSQGTSDALVLFSSRPEYNEKINLLILLSPIGYMGHSASPIVKLIQRYMSLIKLVANLFGFHGISYNPANTLMTEVMCNENSPLQGLCILIMDLFVGFDDEQVDKSLLTVFLSNTPNGISLRDIEHYTQEMSSGYFRRYDYGNSTVNLLHYGRAEPPSYNISKITAPMAIYYAKNDFLASTIDVERVISELSIDTVDRYLVEYNDFNHLDFISAKDVKKLLYDRLIKVIQQNNPVNRKYFDKL